MRFFDCNCFIGLPAVGMLKPARRADDLLAAMDRSGIERALVWHVVQRDYAVVTGNRLLEEAIAGYHDRLTGCWSIMAPQTGEIPPADALFGKMAKANVRALRAFPDRNRYLLRPEACGSLLDGMVERRIPLIVAAQGAGQWQTAYDLLKKYPRLVCIVSDMHVWGTDRWFRPLIETYDHVYVELSEYILDGGVEAFVQSYGAGRLLFGTGFPKWDHGGVMLMLRHAEIPEGDRQAIAAGNVERILGDVRL